MTSKILVWFIYPLSLGITLLVLAYLALLLRRRLVFHALFLVAISMLYLLSIKPVSDLLVEPLESKYLSESQSGLKADVIVVLSGDVKKKNYPRTDIEVSGNRVLKAVRLYKQGAAPLVIMTGGSGDLFDRDYKEAELMRELAVELGVPRSKVIVETESANTRENAFNTKLLLDKLKAKKIILVTSAFHLPRSYALFEKLGVQVLPVGSDFYVTEEDYDPFSFVPSTGALHRSAAAIKEYVGMLVYRLMGWI